MKYAVSSVIAMVLVTAFMSTVLVAQRTKPFTCTYRMFAGEKLVLADEVNYEPGARASDRMTAAEKKEERTMELVYKDGSAWSFEQQLNGLPELRMSREKDLVSFYEREAMVGALPADDHLIALEIAAPGEYPFLLQAYDARKGGRQSFDVIVPSLQDFIRMDVEAHGTDAVEIKGRTMEAAHYRIAIGKREVVNLWASQGRVIGMFLATKGVYIVDADEGTLKEQLKKLVNKAS